jgi:hypothetical protein
MFTNRIIVVFNIYLRGLLPIQLIIAVINIRVIPSLLIRLPELRSSPDLRYLRQMLVVKMTHFLLLELLIQIPILNFLIFLVPQYFVPEQAFRSRIVTRALLLDQ